MKKYTVFFILFTLFFSCNKTVEQKEEQLLQIIPAPAAYTQQAGYFEVGERLSFSTASWEKVDQFLIDGFKSLSGVGAYAKTGKEKTDLLFEKKELSTDEGYELVVSKKQIIIRSKGEIGAFYAVQSLAQLIYNNKKRIPCVEIEDAPRFSWRGMHLDVSRHFFGVETVKKYIDLLALHKMNYFHWHLTDDQGWRIEIKKYPKLTSIGAHRDETLVGHYNDQPHQFDGKPYGGFYTQEEIKEVVAYAKSRFVTVVPEIELPGHAQATLAAYPELGCEDIPLEPMQIWGVSEHVYCPEEATFTFLENVLKEVIELFPGKYIHIGGDECPKIKWEESAFCQNLMKQKGLKDAHELQSYFITRIEKFLNSKDRQIIGWDEILEGGLSPNATVMSWRGIEGGIEAAKQHHDVIMTPTSHCYFDYYQSDHPEEPLAIGGLIPLKKVYNYEPVPEELSAEEGKYVLGTQANLWTEYITDSKKLDYMAFPRVCAIAEIAWQKKENKNFEDFVQRLVPHIGLLRNLKVNTANHLYEINATAQPTGEGVLLKMSTTAPDVEIRYSLDGTTPNKNSTLFADSLLLSHSKKITAHAFSKTGDISRLANFDFDIHKAAGKNITMINQPHPKYKGGGNGSLINGLNGSDERYGDLEWLGFDGTDFEGIIDFQKIEEFEKATFRFFKGEGQWIYLPKSVEILISDDGKTFKEVKKASNIKGDTKVIEFPLNFDKVNGRYLKIIAKNYGEIPKGKQGAGNKSWMFIDEIKIQ